MSRVVARARTAARRARAPAPPPRGGLRARRRRVLHARSRSREAAKGLGRTSPNPAVGAVLVKGGRVIARGHHARAGGPHAEVVALRAAGARARGADLYTTLEPCDHFGRTPPCSAGHPRGRASAACSSARADPEPARERHGASRGCARAGVEVVTGVLARRVRRAQRATGSRSSPSGART